MAKLEISTKRLAISKANTQTVTIVGIASFVTVFCLVASHAILSQTRYQSRVTKADNTAHQELITDGQAYKSLASQYNTFNDQQTNVISGVSGGSGLNDGNNAKIVLDALPSSYDFPALTSSIEKILSIGNFTVSSIGGTDNQLTEQTNNSSANPTAVPMPFTFSVTNTNYASIDQLLLVLQASIRPIAIDQLTISGSDNALTLTINAHTYYQPGKTLDITKEAIQ